MEYYSAVKKQTTDPFKNLDESQRHYVSERASLKRVHTASFHSYDIFKMTKLYDRE